MTQAQRTMAWPGNYSTAAVAALVDCRLLPSDVWAAHPAPRRADEYEVTITLKVRSHDLEDVVARTFADPLCIDVRVQSALR